MMRLLLGNGWRVARGPTAMMLVTSVISGLCGFCIPLLIGSAVAAVPALAAGGPALSSLVVLGALLALILCTHLSATASAAAASASDGLITQDADLRIGWALSHQSGLETLEDATVAGQVRMVRERDWELSMGHQILTINVLSTLITLIGSSLSLALLLAWWAPLPILAVVGVELLHHRHSIRIQMDALHGRSEEAKKAAYAFEVGLGAAAKEVRIFGLAPLLRQRLRDSLVAAYRPYWGHRWRSVRLGSALGLIRAATALAVVSLAISRSGAGTLELAAAAAIVPLVLTLAQLDLLPYTYAERASHTARILEEVAPVADFVARAPTISVSPRVGSESALLAQINAQRQSPPPSTPAPEIVFDQVAFRYPGSDRPVLDQVDLVLPAGRASALVGVNGAGKSTMVKLLIGAYRPTRGRILVDGVDLAGLDPDERAHWQRRIAPIGQDFLRLPLSAGDNVELGTGEVWTGAIEPATLPSTEALDRVAARVGITDLIEALPAGWATPLERTMPGGTDLSGGEWQRIGLARALRAVDAGARVLVLDEPAAALDVESEGRLVAGYLDVARATTSLIISHRFSVVRPVHLIHVLDEGRIVESGDHDTLMGHEGGRYAGLFTLQASRYVEQEDS